MKIKQNFQESIISSQTLPLKGASIFKKILAFVYKLLGRRLLSRLFVTSKQCTGCKRCLKICPNHAIKFRLNNPLRTNKCKGCLLCIYYCPNRAIELHAGTLFGAFLLIFLPYDEYIKRLLAPYFMPNLSQGWSMLLSLILWSCGYAVVVFVFSKISFLLSTLKIIKKARGIPILKKVNTTIHPASIFPILVYQDTSKSIN